jgi:hypothetical protein
MLRYMSRATIDYLAHAMLRRGLEAREREQS